MTGATLAYKTLQRVGDNPIALPSAQYYTNAQALKALNQAQRLFCLITLCLETTADMQLTTAATFHMLEFFANWIAPLRVRIPGGAKLKPSRLVDLASLDNMWTNRPGTPSRYSHSGFDLLGVYKQSDIIVRVTYARSPATLTASGSPEIPEEYHACLIDGAIPILRVKEGQQEFQKVLPLWEGFIDEARRCATYVKARNIEQGYDRIPVEIRRFDLSAMLKKVK